MITATIDTNCLILVIDRKSGYENIEKILNWHRIGKIIIYISNRVFEPDIIKMDFIQQEMISKLLIDYRIDVKGSICRHDISKLDGGDLLDGGFTRRNNEEMKKFRSIVGNDPTLLQKRKIGGKLSNKIGDYDSLLDHFCRENDVFITLDTKDIFHNDRRKKYEEELNLVIKSPEEFIFIIEKNIYEDDGRDARPTNC